MVVLSNLKYQLEITIKALGMKQQLSNDAVVDTYIKKYSEVLSLIDSGATEEKVVSQTRFLLNLARSYMEISSDYKQSFLNEMGKTEQMIKRL